MIIDTFTHAVYADFMFFPITMYRVHSPISYWEPEHYAAEFKLVNSTLLIFAVLYLIVYAVRRYFYEKKKGFADE